MPGGRAQPLVPVLAPQERAEPGLKSWPAGGKAKEKDEQRSREQKESPRSPLAQQMLPRSQSRLW